jgi:ABC-type polysaccharide/polyol phosphate transport system ATPase subunit
MMEAITVQNLTKTFRLSHDRPGSLKALALAFRRVKLENLHALKGISFSVQAGETVAVIGQNGSGKSTLLGIMARVYRPTSGTVIMNGRVSSLLELGAGFHHELTGIENIYLNGSILGMRRRDITKRLDAIISFAELEPFIDAPIRTYSSGMVMRLGFSVAIQVDPDILLVDEVLAVGDESFQKKCYAKVRELQNLGKTIIFVSHDLDAVREVATRAIWLDSGEIRADDGVESVLDAYLAQSEGRP